MHRFAELDHRHGVVAAPVVAGHGVEVFSAHHIAARLGTVLQFHQRQLAHMVSCSRGQHHTFIGQGQRVESGQDVGRQQGGQVQARAVKTGFVVGGHAGLPAKGLEVVRHRADHVGLAVEQVDAAVTVEIDGVVFECASDNGRIKVFSDVDSFLKYVAKAAEAGDGVYNVEIDTGALLASSVPSNMVTWAQSQITRLNKVKTAQAAVIDALDEQLGFMVGWEAGNAAQQAKKAETEAQKVAVTTDIAAIDTEVARLAVIAAG